ncbi:UNVERIFIED_CONTAM: Caffeoylshikimate esterase [Sesamum calycinum]|uniref:Caffeoylshikimate esterase n=1 Tax=Sesamum calycinum TaxID=2727403 RepID=A0AAW2NDD8_9LAMI
MSPEQSAVPPPPPPNFWGDMPEEEYYASQGVRNSKSYFETPHGKLFTQSFLPLDPTLPTKATVFMSHGYGSDTGWMFQKICISYANWGYAVFAADLLGHGRSDGIRCYLGDLNKVAAASLCFFKSVRSEKDLWTGLIFSAPLFVIPEPMKPSKVHLFMYGLLFGLADTWAAMPDNKMVGKAIRDPEKLKIIASNPRSGWGDMPNGLKDVIREEGAAARQNTEAV